LHSGGDNRSCNIPLHMGHSWPSPSSATKGVFSLFVFLASLFFFILVFALWLGPCLRLPPLLILSPLPQASPIPILKQNIDPPPSNPAKQTQRFRNSTNSTTSPPNFSPYHSTHSSESPPKLLPSRHQQLFSNALVAHSPPPENSNATSMIQRIALTQRDRLPNPPQRLHCVICLPFCNSDWC